MNKVIYDLQWVEVAIQRGELETALKLIGEIRSYLKNTPQTASEARRDDFSLNQ